MGTVSTSSVLSPLKSFKDIAGMHDGKAVVSVDKNNNVFAIRKGEIVGYCLDDNPSVRRNALKTRKALLTALNERFGNNIPQNVLKAMNVSKAFSGFSIGKDGVKATNHPLSMRRLEVILRAVEREDAKSPRMIAEKVLEHFYPSLNTKRYAVALSSGWRTFPEPEKIGNVAKFGMT